MRVLADVSVGLMQTYVSGILKISTTTKYALEKCDKVFALSREIADNIKLVAPNKTNIVVIPNYTERISKQIKTPNKNNIHIGCGAFHLNEKKGISLLMRMVASYAQTYNQDITLECVGQIDDDVLEQYQNLADEMQISDMVSFTGRMEREDFKRVQGRLGLLYPGFNL